ncbi:MAG: hypothetical protein WAK10_00965 [Methanoregula sp.]
MDTEIIVIMGGVVLPLYPMLFAIYQKIGRYDEIVEEFKKLRAEHDACKGTYHGK